MNFQFLVFGSVLVLMMLFRREGLIPEARTRLVLREPGRTEAEALGADMEDVAPELEALPDDSVHPGGIVPPAESSRHRGDEIMTTTTTTDGDGAGRAVRGLRDRTLRRSRRRQHGQLHHPRTGRSSA